MLSFQFSGSAKFVLLVSLATAALTTSCAPQAALDTRAADEAAIREADEKWAKAAGAHDLDATVSFYSDDAVLLPPNSPILTDKKSIREGWVPLVGPDAAINWNVTKVDVARSGELGYIYGTYTLAMKGANGKVDNDKGKMIEVWKKQVDGKWKCVADIFNSDLPLPAPPPAK
jgi:ketosteroid isomerase-like protein